jgi:hypothetical protein
MTGMTMSSIFGIFFALAGLALAVVLGLVLYKEEKQESASRKNYRDIIEEGKTG